MISYILINIAVVILITGLDIYRHRLKHLSLSAMLLAITINTIINTFILDKFNFITLTTISMFIIWTLLQIYIDNKISRALISEQKFIAIILTVVVSLTQRVTDYSSTQSIYMSVPFLAPTIFLIGCIFLFVATFHNEYNQSNKKQYRFLTIGLVIINISFIVMMILTPYWYLYLIIYMIFMLFLFWQKIFNFN
ncbi:hypothetical protein J3T65_04905 [Staphylococcus simiae]|uniref:hypothetical protein n=1 Tax=Staphylococcus simiae TaxID=308354 RepID=UPI001A973F63|nr:hypothetical protein [Staphylococcus simiae]MBO1198807.1 hypothetical protein [Staphylococcus simiae]MBO1200754.1 hypothetical protein [Staphylococcus simiae]MBO1203267.1 hypothetical protein [Staphylococcus simiae]MBO1210562.1 hypothetical protein [Staphylococcus simiae]MBO1229090.1 hypothetical protein [Staphylococcus simiae]